MTEWRLFFHSCHAAKWIPGEPRPGILSYLNTWTCWDIYWPIHIPYRELLICTVNFVSFTCVLYVHNIWNHFALYKNNLRESKNSIQYQIDYRWKSREVIGWGQHENSCCGDLFERPVSNSVRLFTEMSKLKKEYPFSHIFLKLSNWATQLHLCVSKATCANFVNIFHWW